MKAQRGVEVQLHSFFNLGTTWGGWSTPRPDHFYLRDRDPVPIVRVQIGTQMPLRLPCFQIQGRQRCAIVLGVITEDGNFLHRLYEYLRSPIALTVRRTALKSM